MSKIRKYKFTHTHKKRLLEYIWEEVPERTKGEETAAVGT